ncbi:HHR121Cp [Eremothecium sinecaudum]|uniref:HHR121Cp n=1 Tax=Eremothecium sinecaudum TaxID=45286 RepID=A0A120K2X3_9SACH|nr:HHR121Cp [Eremothecium sinecaudum]AMD22890.1 HHR121Cp [Eremothecium sinecaudum]
MKRNLVVLGGNGFLGKRICQLALHSGKFSNITSLSRSGIPPANDEPWMDSINWERCDVLDPATYVDHLKEATDVVHSIGILLENPDYKANLRKGPLSLASNLFNMVLPLNKNPLKTDPKFTYDAINRYSASLLAETFAEMVDASGERRPTITYISADKGFPLIPSGYINSKRAAEVEIMRQESKIRPILLRPGFMFDESRNAEAGRAVIKSFLDILNCGNQLILRKNISFVNDLIRPVVSTQQVSRALLHFLEDENHAGVVSLESILEVKA